MSHTSARRDHAFKDYSTYRSGSLDITAVTAGTAISGGGTSGAVVINVTVADADLLLAGQVYN